MYEGLERGDFNHYPLRLYSGRHWVHIKKRDGVKLGHGIGPGAQDLAVASDLPLISIWSSIREMCRKKSWDLPSTLRAKSNLMWFRYELDLSRHAHRCLIGLGSGESGVHILNSKSHLWPFTTPHCHQGLPLPWGGYFSLQRCSERYDQSSSIHLLVL